MKSKSGTSALKTHLTYNWWKYLIAVIVGIFGVDLLYTVTEPRVPDSARLEIIVNGYMLRSGFDEYLEKVRIAEFPDILETNVSIAMDDDSSTAEYLTTRMAVHEGDLYILSRSEYTRMVENGVLQPLEKDDELIHQILAGVEINEGWVLKSDPEDSEDSEKKHLYGISLNYLPALNYFFSVKDGFLCVYRYGGKPEVAQKLLRIIVNDTKAMPEAQSPEPPANTPTVTSSPGP